jgi:hypothetical protein
VRRLLARARPRALIQDDQPCCPNRFAQPVFRSSLPMIQCSRVGGTYRAVGLLRAPGIVRECGVQGLLRAAIAPCLHDSQIRPRIGVRCEHGGALSSPPKKAAQQGRPSHVASSLPQASSQRSPPHRLAQLLLRVSMDLENNWPTKAARRAHIDNLVLLGRHASCHFVRRACTPMRPSAYS